MKNLGSSCRLPIVMPGTRALLAVARSDRADPAELQHAETLKIRKPTKGKAIKMAEDKGSNDSGEFDVLPESELEDLVGGQLTAIKFSNLTGYALLKPVNPGTFAGLKVALCLYDDPR